jgi:hypothetical protein
MTSNEQQQNAWHELTHELVSDEERATSERTRKWVVRLIWVLLAWICVVFLAFVPRFA